MGVQTVQFGAIMLVTATAIKIVSAAIALYQMRTKAAAVAQAALLALQGPKGLALLATGLGAASFAAYKLDQAFSESTESASAAAEANAALADEAKAAKEAFDGFSKSSGPDVTPKGTPQLVSTRIAAEKLLGPRLTSRSACVIDVYVVVCAV